MRSLTKVPNKTLELLLWERNNHGSVLSQENRKTFLDVFKPDVVLHLAWQSTSDLYYELDPAHEEWATATSDFASECVHRNIWFIAAGSAIDEQYDSSVSHLESSDYLKSKRRLRRHFKSLMQYTSRLTWLQIQYVFSMSELRPRVLRAVMTSKDPNSFSPDSPDSMHDFIHIDDVATAISRVVLSSATGEISVGTGCLIKTKDFVEIVKYHAGFRQTRPDVNLRRTDVFGSILRDLNWLPVESLKFLGQVIEEQRFRSASQETQLEVSVQKQLD